jgi:hypothetical protein
MGDIKEFARHLAAQTKEKMNTTKDVDKLQLHRARVLDAESRPFWDATINELLSGMAEYDLSLTGTPCEQHHLIERQGSSVTVTWRYPTPQKVDIAFDFERRLIQICKEASPPSTKHFRLCVSNEDSLYVSDVKDGSKTYSDATAFAEVILSFTIAGSM